MTGYYITIGYNSHIAGDEAVLKEKFIDIYRQVRANGQALLDDALRVEGIAISEKYLEPYRVENPDDASITLRDDMQDVIGNVRISQYASGGGEGRRAKEALRRAFCRVFLAAAHKAGLEVNINVV